METEILKIDRLCKKYGKKYVLSNITANINKGKIYGIVGENGAGKTTLMRIILKLIYQTSGTISLSKETNIGGLVEAPALYHSLSAYENLKYYAQVLSIDDKERRIEEILSCVGLSDVEKNKKVKDYSLGMKQRLAIALTILDKPNILVLDEPTNGLDPVGVRDIRNLILKLRTEYDMTILISSHILRELDSVADCYLIMNKGKLITQLSNDDLLQNKIVIQVSDIKLAYSILNDRVDSVEIVNKNIEIKDETITVDDVISILREKNIKIEGIYKKRISFEDYYFEKKE
ncbi:ATP-binding cassette domain-containing protein [uncultured Enterococcus sp.]|uniref:ATP-binding cassette domain-containing protein n=1 Tax=uncultured Enterococcus sp. TaxID=167972 RepID=UPI00260D9B60|nr:ATP-binding cassette domain-containing protein [uncultured Enterococcus sp.]